MNFSFDRIFRSKDIEWITFHKHDEGLRASLVLNDADRSKDFSEDKDLARLKEISGDDLGNEYFKAHLFITNKDVYDKFAEGIGDFYHQLVHNLNVHSWLFVHYVKDPFKEAQKYLEKWGVDKKVFNINDREHKAFDHLSQD